MAIQECTLFGTPLTTIIKMVDFPCSRIHGLLLNYSQCFNFCIQRGDVFQLEKPTRWWKIEGRTSRKWLSGLDCNCCTFLLNWTLCIEGKHFKAFNISHFVCQTCLQSQESGMCVCTNNRHGHDCQWRRMPLNKVLSATDGFNILVLVSSLHAL